MKIALISHDVDHIKPWEHLLKDLIIPKFLVRNKIELLKGKISFKEYILRLKDVLLNEKWNQIESIIAFHKQFNIPSTFFVGVNNGVGLSYNIEGSTWAIQTIIQNNFDVGVHGITYNNIALMAKEHELFKTISERESFGIRMHYLRNNVHTLEYLQKVGYSFDATLHELQNPYINSQGLIEIPIHIMDGWILNGNKRYQSVSFEEAKKETLIRLEKLDSLGVSYYSILFHDRYFTPSFSTWKQWYEWLIDYLIQNNFKFMNHSDVAQRLKTNETL